MKTKLTILMMLVASFGLIKAAELPLDFESGTYEFTDFDGGAVTVIDNPQSSGINTSLKVAQMVKSANQTWGGSYITLDNPIDFSTNKTFKMKVYSPRVGAKVLLKVENLDDGGIAYEKEVETTVANEWEELTFDYNMINAANSYQKIILIFDNGIMGDGSADYTFLFDDIKLVTEEPTLDPPALPLDFESSTVDYTFTDFDGGAVTVIDNPQSSGINTSLKVAQMVKNENQTWGGSYIILGGPIDFSSDNTFKMKVYSPRVGAKVLLKVENLDDAGISYEKEMETTVANEWEELTFDYSLINTENSYQKVIFIFENGIMGDGSADYTFLFDDIKLVYETPTLDPPSLPLDFESSTVDYTFTNFDGGEVTILDNTQSSGINTSAKVAQMVKNAGQPWGGGWIALGAPIDFSAGTMFKMKVFSPRAGAKVLLKVENISNAGIAFEKELATTKANEWEELTFDFSEINTSESYQKVVLIFDLGTMGDGSANFTFLFDDIMLEGITGVEEDALSNLSIYTFNKQLVVNCENELLDGKIEVFDLTGRKILNSLISDTNTRINLEKSGIYIVRISDSSNLPVASKNVLVN
jgi:hypothetical protein